MVLVCVVTVSNYGVCGDCNAIDLVTVVLVCVVIVMPLIWLR